MEFVVADVKENVGSGMLKVKIISRSKINDSTINLIKNMTLDEVREYGKIRGWTVLVLDN